MLREYVSSEFRSEYKENVLYNSHGKNRRRLSLEESPFEGPPKFQVRAYIGGDTSSYTISGASGNPTLTLLRSKTYIFDIATNGHPFMIQYADGTAYTDGMNFERSSWGDSGYAGMDRTITFTILKMHKYFILQMHDIHLLWRSFQVSLPALLII